MTLAADPELKFDTDSEETLYVLEGSLSLSRVNGSGL